MWGLFRNVFGLQGPSDTARVGRRGERLARKFLKRQGLKVLAQNYRCPAGELDLIALDPTTRSERGRETIAFVEVKTRRSDRHTAPESAVDDDKQRRMQKVAQYYLNTHETSDLDWRFDVVAIVIRDREKPQINYIPNAF